MAQISFNTISSNLDIGNVTTGNATSIRVVNVRDMFVGNSTSNVGNLVVYGNGNATITTPGSIGVTGDAVIAGNVLVEGAVRDGNSSGRIANTVITNAGSYALNDVIVTFDEPTGTVRQRATGTVVYTGATSPFSIARINITNTGSGYLTPPNITFSSSGTVTTAAAATAQLIYPRCTTSYANSNVTISPGDIFYSQTPAATVYTSFAAMYTHDGGSTLRVVVGNATQNAPAGIYKCLGGFFAGQARGLWQCITRT